MFATSKASIRTSRLLALIGIDNKAIKIMIIRNDSFR